jgi:hypothetical protein
MKNHISLVKIKKRVSKEYFHLDISIKVVIYSVYVIIQGKQQHQQTILFKYKSRTHIISHYR